MNEKPHRREIPTTGKARPHSVISIVSLFWRQLEQEKRVDDFMKGRPDREVDIFAEALKVSSHERGALLERLCDGDEDLRRKVEKLLRAHDRLGNFMKKRPTGESID